MLSKTINDKYIIFLEERIDSVNAQSVENELEHLIETHENIELNAEKLEYISSAGLRVLLKLKKKNKGTLTICDVFPEVYEILEVTGFTEILNVNKKLRQISIDGCEKIGQGGNGTVYRLDSDTIIKVYNKGNSLDKIAEEKKYATEAFKCGIPTAISFDTVKVGEQYGIVFEMLNARTVGEAVSDNPEKTEEYGILMGRLLKLIHETETADNILPKMSDKISGWIDYLEEHYINHEDAELMREVLHNIPESNHFTHCDFHEGNVMIQNDELILIDLDDIATGHPIYDLTFNYMSHVIAAQSSPQAIKRSLKMSPELAPEIRKVMLKTYFDTSDETVIQKYEQAIAAFSPFLLMLTPAKSKNSENLPPDIAKQLIEFILPKFKAVAKVLPSLVQVFD